MYHVTDSMYSHPYRCQGTSSLALLVSWGSATPPHVPAIVFKGKYSRDSVGLFQSLCGPPTFPPLGCPDAAFLLEVPPKPALDLIGGLYGGCLCLVHQYPPPRRFEKEKQKVGCFVIERAILLYRAQKSIFQRGCFLGCDSDTTVRQLKSVYSIILSICLIAQHPFQAENSLNGRNIMYVEGEVVYVCYTSQLYASHCNCLPGLPPSEQAAHPFSI